MQAFSLVLSTVSTVKENKIWISKNVETAAAGVRNLKILVDSAKRKIGIGKKEFSAREKDFKALRKRIKKVKEDIEKTPLPPEGAGSYQKIMNKLAGFKKEPKGLEEDLSKRVKEMDEWRTTNEAMMDEEQGVEEDAQKKLERFVEEREILHEIEILWNQITKMGEKVIEFLKSVTVQRMMFMGAQIFTIELKDFVDVSILKFICDSCCDGVEKFIMRFKATEEAVIPILEKAVGVLQGHFRQLVKDKDYSLEITNGKYKIKLGR